VSDDSDPHLEVTPRSSLWRRATSTPTILVVAIAVWCPLLVHAIRSVIEGDGNDFTILHAAARRFLVGESLYDGTYMYPPLFAIFLSPLALLPAALAGILWAVAKIPLFYFAAATFFSKGAIPPSTRHKLVLLSPLLVFRFVESDLVNGNTNIPLLAGFALALKLIEGGREISAGFALALVSAVKLSPIYLILCLGVSKRWKTAAIAGTVLVGLLVTSGILSADGWQKAKSGFLFTSQSVFQPDELDRDANRSGYLPGQSLRPIVHRLNRPIDATAHDRKHIAINIFDLRAGTAEWIYRALGASLALIGLFACRSRSTRWTMAWSLAVMLLISPYSRKAHFVLLLPANAVIIVAIFVGARSKRPRLIATLMLTWTLGQLSTRALWGKAGAAILLAYGVVGAAALILLPGMWWARNSGAEEQPQEDSPAARATGESGFVA
jgi:hypothetical protein